MIRVVIVEDDALVAEVNKHYLASVDGFQWVGTAANSKQALTLLNEQAVDLVLLDIFMPGKNGLELLAEMRKRNDRVDVIVISAASDVENIQTALRLGAVDYLIKPFEFERLQTALKTYQKERAVMVEHQQMSQTELDQLLLHQTAAVHGEPRELPKGLTHTTLGRTVAEILHLDNGEFSTETLAHRVHVSRVSMRKYLLFLSDIGFLQVKLNYQSGGRPVYTYFVNQANAGVVRPYLVS